MLRLQIEMSNFKFVTTQKKASLFIPNQNDGLLVKKRTESNPNLVRFTFFLYINQEFHLSEKVKV